MALDYKKKLVTVDELLVKNPLSILWRCLSGIAGLLAGGFFGMAALQLLMLLIGSDFGLSNVRPGFIVGGVIGFLLGVYLPKKRI